THVDAADLTIQAIAERDIQQKAPAAPAKAAALAQAPAQAPSSPQVPAGAPKAPQAAPKAATPASAASTKFQHARDATVAQITNGTPGQAVAAQQIPC
ncbi:unnamed protein product, partial [Tilletia controversa]